MKPLIILVSIYSFSFSAKSFAGNENSQAGAASAGMAHASVTLTDVWSCFNNQAGTAYLDRTSAGIYNEFRYGMKETSFNAFAVAVPLKNLGTFSLSASYLGYTQYNEQKIGLSYARKFGNNISASLQFDYLSANFADEYYGNKNAFTIEAGFRAVILPKLSLAFHVYNPISAKFADYDNEHIPVIFKLGLCYEFNDKVKAAIESEKNINEKNIFRLGIDYHISKPLFLRTGFSSNYTTGYFGFGLLIKQLQIDFAASFHQVLGFTPHTSLTYKF